MTIKFRSAIVLSSLLFVLSLHPAAKADTIHVVAGVDSVTCATVGDCTLPVSFTADFTMTPGELFPYGPVEFIDSMTGTFNGFPAMEGPGGFFLGTFPVFNPITFTSDGSQYQIGLDDVLDIGPRIDDLSAPSSSYITWNATLVSTPEPSSLLLLLLGTGALLVGLALFKNKPCTC